MGLMYHLFRTPALTHGYLCPPCFWSRRRRERERGEEEDEEEEREKGRRGGGGEGEGKEESKKERNKTENCCLFGIIFGSCNFKLFFSIIFGSCNFEPCIIKEEEEEIEREEKRRENRLILGSANDVMNETYIISHTKAKLNCSDFSVLI